MSGWSSQGPEGKSLFEAPEPRYRVLTLSSHLVADAVFQPRRLGDAVHCLTVEGLPEGCRVEAVAYDFFRDVFVFRLYHESFTPVTQGDAIPEIEATLRADYLQVAGEARRGREFI